MLPPTAGRGRHGGGADRAMFPNLKERAGSQGTRLSAASSRCWRWRASCAPARLLLLDEISEGLAPVIVQKLAEMVVALRKQATPS